MKRWIGICLVTAISLGACNKALNPQQATAIQQTVRSQNYVFKVESVNPTGGGNIQMTPGYDLVVTSGLVEATLPYFGRAYFPPLDPNSGGFRFTSKQFRYEATPREGSWDILIIPRDVPDIQEMRLNITADGYATLHIISNSRQAISYYGNVTKNKVATNQ